MAIDTATKTQIANAIKADFQRRRNIDSDYSQTRHATWLSINNAVYSSIAKGDYDKKLKNTEWLRLAMQLNIDTTGHNWKTANTHTYEYVTAQLGFCQDNGVGRILCDEKGLGKTRAAEAYALENGNVAYIKCGSFPTRHLLIREIARQFGLDNIGTVHEVRMSMIAEIRAMQHPIIILDDGGYLSNEAWMEVKALYDELPYQCAWYVIGDMGLKKKIEGLVRHGRIGYESLMDRFGGGFKQITGECTSDAELAMFKSGQLKAVLEVNEPKLPKAQQKELIARCKNSLRLLQDEVIKYRHINKTPSNAHLA